MLSPGRGESGALSWANDTCGHTESDGRQSQRPTPRVKPEYLPSRQKTKRLKLLTFHRHISARVEVLEQTHLGRFLLLQVVPSIPRSVLGIHGAADVVPPDQVYSKQLVVCHGRSVTLEFCSETVGILQSELRLAHATDAVDGADATLAVLPRVPNVLTQECNLLFPSGEEIVLDEVDLEHGTRLDVGRLAGWSFSVLQCLKPANSDAIDFNSCLVLKPMNVVVNLGLCLLELVIHPFPYHLHQSICQESVPS